MSTFFLCNYSVQAQNFVVKEEISSSTNQLESDFKQLYLVFAGPYPASPSSAFGHLFFLIQPTSKESNPQLWRAINFSADVEGYSGFSTFYNGLIGNLDGTFDELSFYKKIRDYSYAESRDLWLFTIDLDEEEKVRFTNYIDHRRDSLLQYSFINKNCATRVKEALYHTIEESRSNDIYVLPQDVLEDSKIKKRLSQPLWIENIEGQLAEINSNYDTENVSTQSDSLGANEKVYLLKTLEWLYNNNSESIDPEKLELIRELRLQVAQEKSEFKFGNLKSKEFNIHPPSLVGVNYLYTNNTSTNLKVDLRVGLHSFIDDAITYPKYDYIDILRFQTVFNDNHIYLDEFWVFNQQSRQPQNKFNSSISWSLGIGGDRYLYNDQLLMAFGLYSGIGQTVSIIEEGWITSFILSLNTTYLEKNTWSLIVNPKLENRIFVTPKLKGLIEVSNPVFLQSDKNFEPKLKFKGIYSVAENIYLTNTIELQSDFYSAQLGLSFNFNL